MLKCRIYPVSHSCSFNATKLQVPYIGSHGLNESDSPAWSRGMQPNMARTGHGLPRGLMGEVSVYY